MATNNKGMVQKNSLWYFYVLLVLKYFQNRLIVVIEAVCVNHAKAIKKLLNLTPGANVIIKYGHSVTTLRNKAL